MKKSVILVVDSDEEFRRNIGKKLKKLGHNVFFAEDGDAGIEFTKKNFTRLNLVIVSQGIPKRSGEELLRFVDRYFSSRIRRILVVNELDSVVEAVAKSLGAETINKQSLVENLEDILKLFPELNHIPE